MPPRKDPYLNEAFAKAVSTLAQDMPVLMHGSGDVLPNQVDPDADHLVSALTMQYVSQLVDAAIDSHDILRDGSSVRSVPPPAFPSRRTPPIPPPPDSRKAKLKRHRASDEYWDEPLPEPKIRGKEQKTGSANVHVDQWVGVAGVDLSESRTRSAYVRGPAALSTQSFVFPVCHDVYAYGRVTEVQSAKRAIAPVLYDSVVTEMVRTEGRLHHAHAHKDEKKGRDGTSDPEDEDNESNSEENEEDVPSWPGLDSLLPVHTSEDQPAFDAPGSLI